MSAVDTYHVIAKYYDGAYAAKQDLVDLPFYLDLAEPSRGPILEIACGTGRVLLPIARKGIEICGVDNSQPMLDVLNQNLAGESQEVRNRITVHRGDMRNFRLDRKFPLVMIPFRPMQHLFTVEDQIAALKTAAAHLTDAGTLVFDVFYPKFDMIWTNVGEEVPEMEWTPSSDPTKLVRRFFRKDAIDKINQIFSFTFIFRTYQSGDLILEETEAFRLCYYTCPHLRALFLLAGLEPVAEYGSFAKTPMDNTAEQMIFLLRKSS
ncbi:MAG TPA: class I SAM-dependent methyltransferase [Candidatus Sulfotelmatobacter sp.]